VVYQDEHLACIVKPQGMPTQGRGATVQARIKHCLEPTKVHHALRHPHQVGRGGGGGGSAGGMLQSRSVAGRAAPHSQPASQPAHTGPLHCLRRPTGWTQ
jgi:cyanophycinase-like exopeptidase